MMGNWGYNNWDNMMHWSGGWGFGAGLSLFVIWTLLWSGLALWRTAKEDNKYWFIAFLLLHTGGILEIAYLFFFAKNKLTLSTTPGKSSSIKKK